MTAATAEGAADPKAKKKRKRKKKTDMQVDAAAAQAAAMSAGAPSQHTPLPHHVAMPLPLDLDLQPMRMPALPQFPDLTLGSFSTLMVVEPRLSSFVLALRLSLR